jgi:hypothetical protein
MLNNKHTRGEKSQYDTYKTFNYLAGIGLQYAF